MSFILPLALALALRDKRHCQGIIGQCGFLVVGCDHQLFSFLRVDAIVLHDEQDIVEYDHDSEDELDDVDLDVLAEEGLQRHLREGEQAAREVEDDVGDRPSLG